MSDVDAMVSFETNRLHDQMMARELLLEKQQDAEEELYSDIVDFFTGIDWLPAYDQIAKESESYDLDNLSDEDFYNIAEYSSGELSEEDSVKFEVQLRNKQ